MSYIQPIESVNEEARLLADRATAEARLNRLQSFATALETLLEPDEDYSAPELPGHNFFSLCVDVGRAVIQAKRDVQKAEAGLKRLDAERWVRLATPEVVQFAIQAGQP